MTDTTKPALSRADIEVMAYDLETDETFTERQCHLYAATLRALLDAKEAAEREAKERADAAEGYRKTIRGLMDQLNAAKEAAHD